MAVELFDNRLTKIVPVVFLLLMASPISSAAASASSIKCEAFFGETSNEQLWQIARSFTKPTYVLERGFAHTGFHAGMLLRLMAGDRTHELRSKVYQRFLADQLAGGLPLETSIERADALTARTILERFRMEGAEGFIRGEFERSLVMKSRGEKDSSVLHAARGGQIDALLYAKNTMSKGMFPLMSCVRSFSKSIIQSRRRSNPRC